MPRLFISASRPWPWIRVGWVRSAQPALERLQACLQMPGRLQGLFGGSLEAAEEGKQHHGADDDQRKQDQGQVVHGCERYPRSTSR